MTYVLGLNAYHADAAACLVKDGTLVAAVEEERFRRIKHWGGFPSESIRYCLAEAGIALGDVEHVAVNSDNRANRWRKLAYVADLGRQPGLCAGAACASAAIAPTSPATSSAHLPEQEFRGTVHAVEHHLCHLASAFLVSPYDKAVAVSVDGFGDFSSAAWGLGEGGTLAVDGRVYFPHSLGVFYEAMTQFIGFPHYGDEYKVMGLAPYGEPRYVEHDEADRQAEGRRHLRARPALLPPRLGRGRQLPGEGRHPVGRPAVERCAGANCSGRRAIRRRRSRIATATSRARRRSPTRTPSSICCGALHRRYGTDAVVLAGGCAYNSVANGKVLERSPFKKLYVQSAGGDAGGAIGAAFATWHKAGRRGRQAPLRDGSRLLGSVGDARPDRRRRSTRAAPTSRPRAAPSSASATRRRSAGARPRRSPRAR